MMVVATRRRMLPVMAVAVTRPSTSTLVGSILIGIVHKFEHAIQVRNHCNVDTCLRCLHATMDIDHNVKCNHGTLYVLSSSISDGGKGDGCSRRVISTGNAAIELHDSSINS